MAMKTNIEVVIDGKVYTMSGYESADYLHKIASYINNKITELKSLSDYKRLGTDMQKILLELNIADDYYKAKKRISDLELDIEDKDQFEYNLKHQMIDVQMQLEEALKEVEKLKADNSELQKQIMKLELKREQKA